MSRRAKQIWAVVALVAMVSFIIAWPIYKKLRVKEANAALIERVKKAVKKNPHLQADWDRAIEEDGVLTWPKANAILKKAGEKAEPED
jgi:hypothetical protein